MFDWEYEKDDCVFKFQTDNTWTYTGDATTLQEIFDRHLSNYFTTTIADFNYSSESTWNS